MPTCRDSFAASSLDPTDNPKNKSWKRDVVCTPKRPLVLLILDGFGYHNSSPYNAIEKANPSQWNQWWQTNPHSLLEASGENVGLPSGQMGNSEVGHMHIAAGRTILQDYTRINAAISSGEFNKNPVFLQLIHDVSEKTPPHASSTSFRALSEESPSVPEIPHYVRDDLGNIRDDVPTLHVMGLLSKGGVHSHQEHLFAFLKLCHEHGLQNIQLHLFLDGRDTPPKIALEDIAQLNLCLEQYPCARIASLSGRYFAMDRDNRWERTEAVYKLLTKSTSQFKFPTAETAVQAFYNDNITDEFIPPTLIGEPKPIVDGDSIFFFNFRSDRARQLTHTFLDDSFDFFIRNHKIKLQHFVCMTEYNSEINTEIAFPPRKLPDTLGEIISKHGLTQLRVAETEKYAHVTFFFNGGVEHPFPGETRVLIPSPKVSSYDLKPEMSIQGITEVIVDAILSQTYDVIIANFANADMVGHTGNMNAAINAIKNIDKSLAKIGAAINHVHGHLLITADHGNAEIMFDEKTKQPHTAHTNEPVPFVYVGPLKCSLLPHGSLIDVAPTVLQILNIPIPSVMEGHSLLSEGQI